MFGVRDTLACLVTRSKGSELVVHQSLSLVLELVLESFSARRMTIAVAMRATS